MRAGALVQCSISVVLAGLGLAHGAQPASDFDALVNAPAIHCEFYPGVRPADAPVSGTEPIVPEVLVHYGGMNRDRTRARVVSTRGAGSREVVVMRTEKGVHFVDHVAGVFMVTTVFACNEREQRSSARRCVSFGAVNSRHFDASVHWQPDDVFERYRHLANHGFCDHSSTAISDK